VNGCVHRQILAGTGRWSGLGENSDPIEGGCDRAGMIFPMARYRITLEYAGTKYSGWQKQKNARTVQGEIERAIGAATGQRQFEFQGSGRTDAGVHALHQVAHLEIAVRTTPEGLRRQINDELPADINLLRIDPAPPRFHARHGAAARSYLYQICRRRSAFAKPYVWWVKDGLAIEAMRDAARHLTGMHDFQSFSDDDPDEKSTDVLVEDVAIAEDGDLVLVRVGGSHFIWKMVRRMVGVLVEVGTGRLAAGAVPALLREASGVPAKVTAPASGLFLERVYYPGDERRLPLVPAFPVSSGPASGARARR
jgi:tRNA pseudouridine38-40 synthase